MAGLKILDPEIVDPEIHEFRVQWTSEVDKHMGLVLYYADFWSFGLSRQSTAYEHSWLSG